MAEKTVKTATQWRAGSASDAGLERPNNEDRVLVDEARGLFLVVDGLGGHAAGELAAETAVNVIDRTLSSSAGDVEKQIKQAIIAANNEICRLAESNSAWSGMACVLTLALVQNERVTIGHVGDSRLYLIWNGKLRKLTSDHSPVGEQEDAGQLSEQQAMHHPRRNEVFRDVGSRLHNVDDTDFIETRGVLFRADAALLLCSDGLTDYVNSTEISAIIERYDGDPNHTAQLLVEAANAAGGRDNISVVFVAGSDFLGSDSSTYQDVRSRHATTRMRGGTVSWRRVLVNTILILAGMLLGVFLWRWLDHFTEHPTMVPKDDAASVHAPHAIQVNASDSLGIIKALSNAAAGDTISVPPGDYLGPLELKDRVTIVATAAHQATIHSDPASTTDPGIAIVARNVSEARLRGLKVAADDTHPLRSGVLIADSSPELEDLEISGAVYSGVRIEGDSHPLLLGNQIHSNPGVGVAIRDHSAPRLTGNRISDNGRVPGALHAGLEIAAESMPVLENNVIVQNGAATVLPPDTAQQIRENNILDPPNSSTPVRDSAGAGRKK